MIRCDSSQAKCLFFVSIHNQLYEKSMVIFVLIRAHMHRDSDLRSGRMCATSITPSEEMKKSFYLDDSRHSIDWAPQSIDWDHSHRRAAA